MTLRYRPEIDGLRALAVSAVVLFHAKIPGFSGGFVGVDIFFVISGFLITSIILQQQHSGGFTYRGFIARRARRILPAVAVVMVASVPFAYALMLPDPLQNFGQSLVATAFSANNILLWLTSGYWDLASEFKPLLHTWSLGVEEQFYIFYPFVLLLALRMSDTGRIVILSLLAASSFGLMLWASERDPTGAFYLFQNRAWQLLAGCLASLVVFQYGVKPRLALASLGTVMMVATILGGAMTVSLVPFSLVVPTLGAVLFLLFADREAGVGRMFALRPVVFIGLISYSLYLWHQPVFAFTRIAVFEEPGLNLYVFGIVVAFLLAVLSWRFIEQPFRDPRKIRNSIAFSAISTGFVSITFLGLLMHTSAGLPSRMEVAGSDPLGAGATIVYNERIHDLPEVYDGAREDVLRIAIIGNSFARDFANVLLEARVHEEAFLLYRNDISHCPLSWSQEDVQLVTSSDVVVFASGRYRAACISELDRQFGEHTDAPQFLFVGPKNFGHNLNPLVRMSPEERAATELRIPERTLLTNSEQASRLGDRYVNLINVLSNDGQTIRVADDHGQLLTTDRIHLSKAGAVFVAQRLAFVAPDLAGVVSLANQAGN